MRTLAARLGVEAMSLYHYFPGKDALHAAMLDEIYSEIALPRADGDWRDAIKQTATSGHETLLRHAWACALLAEPSAPSSARLAWMDSVLGRLRGAGFSDVLTHYAYHAIDSHIVGFTLWLLPYLELAGDDPRFIRAIEKLQSEVADFPHVVEHAAVHQRGTGGVGAFEFGLDLLLDGLERERQKELSEPA
jgi:AcrR family transcriptional regulator